MKTKVRVDMLPVNTIMTRLGVTQSGVIQRYVTEQVNDRITAYMPYRTGYLSGKAKFIESPTKIVVLGPYARYQYYGKKMVLAARINGPAFIPGVGFRWKKGAVLRVTDIPLDQSHTGPNNPYPGPLWDRRMMAAEGAQIAADVQKLIERSRSL